MSKTKKTFENKPFNQLKAKNFATKTSPNAKPPSQDKTDKSPKKNPDKVVKNQNDEFLKAMEGVKPLEKGKKLNFSKQKSKNIHPASVKNDFETMEDLIQENAGLVFDPEFSDEYVEFKVDGISQKEFSKLKKGQYPPEEHLDLHGLTLIEAERETHEFIIKNSRTGKRVLLLITGRGLGSEDGVPVIKKAVPSWLLSSALRKRILAFCSARQKDGGLGALYILLKRKLTPQD